MSAAVFWLAAKGGRVFWRYEHGAVAVPRATVDALAGPQDLMSALGYAISGETRLAADDKGEFSNTETRLQFFEHGIVTNRSGIIEARLRPGNS